MTVAELIAELQRVPGGSRVAILIQGSEFLEWRTEMSVVEREDGKVVITDDSTFTRRELNGRYSDRGGSY